MSLSLHLKTDRGKFRSKSWPVHAKHLPICDRCYTCCCLIARSATGSDKLKEHWGRAAVQDGSRLVSGQPQQSKAIDAPLAIHTCFSSPGIPYPSVLELKHSCSLTELQWCKNLRKKKERQELTLAAWMSSSIGWIDPCECASDQFGTVNST